MFYSVSRPQEKPNQNEEMTRQKFQLQLLGLYLLAVGSFITSYQRIANRQAWEDSKSFNVVDDLRVHRVFMYKNIRYKQEQACFGNQKWGHASKKFPNARNN